MGIYKLMNLLNEKAPNSVRRNQIEMYSGKVIACDASMAMYQFLISTQGYNQNQNTFQLTELTDKEGNRTGHLVGLFNRSLQYLENDIKPVWVFDGKPPKFKSGELARRKKAKEEAREKMEEAKEEGDMEEALKQKLRTTTITHQMKEDAKTMLKLMGMPIVDAPCEAEAQCAYMALNGKVYATASEDMDALTLRTPILLRGFNSKKEPITEINYDEVLQGLELNYDEFVDLCILCGCDFCETIDGIGPVTAYKLIKEHHNIEKIIDHLEKENEIGNKKRKYVISNDFRTKYQEVREIFKNPEVIDSKEISIKFNKPDEEALKKFLVEEKGFSEARVISGLKKIKNKDTKGYQSHLESFFGKPVVVKRKENGSDKKSLNKANSKKIKPKTAKK